MQLIDKVKWDGWFVVLILYVPVNSYHELWDVSSPNRTIFQGKLD